MQKYGYKQVWVRKDWLNIVKEKYDVTVKGASSPVMDVRCPKTKQILDELGVTSEFTIPAIEPILIHCAREISEREDLKGDEKVVTTPCQALADMGNALGFKKTTFMPWNQFLGMFPEPLSVGQLGESPIPPGFFKGLELQSKSLMGEDEIRAYFQTRSTRDMTDFQLMELLCCKHGCHNGDGILATDKRKCE